MQSIVDALGTEAFPRLRMGVGCSSSVERQIDYVLGDFSERETEQVVEMLGRTVLAVRCWLEDGIEKAMSRFNGPAQKGEAEPGGAAGSGAM